MTPEHWQNLKRIFHEALELAHEDRSGFLDKACGEDLQLRSAIEEMLASEKEAGEFLEKPNDDFQTIVGDLADAADNLIGNKIGVYRIEKIIGEGGMGMVYLGRREDQDFEQKAAIKIIKTGLNSAALLKRFREERRTLAALQHPNIARLYDGGASEDGTPYLVMEHVEGEPINAFCDARQYTVKKRMELFLKVCAAVAYAHQNLVIHRDLKPGNILVTAAGEPKLLDFGIAKVLHHDPEQHAAEQTTAGIRFLTPEYSSPEQIRGESVSTASDVYSLGVLLYVLLTNSRPYRFQSHSPLGIEKTFASTAPTRASSLVKESTTSAEDLSDEISDSRKTTRGKLRRQLQGDIDNILLKTVQAEPSRRYPTVDQLADDLRRYLSGLPVIARQDSLGYRASKFIKRHRAAFTAVSIVFLALIAGIAGVSWQAKIARDEAAKSRQTLEFVKQMLAAANPLESGKELTVEQLLDEATRRIPKELNTLPETEGDIRTILGEAYQNLGHYDKAFTQLQENLNLQQQLNGRQHSRVANAHRLLAVVEHYRGNVKAADSLYRRAIADYETIGETKSGDYGIALNDFGTMLLDQAKYDSAIVVFRKSFRIVENFYGKNHFQLGSVLNNLAYALDDKGKYRQADSVYQRALSIFRHNYGDEHPEIANTLNNLAFVKLNVGDTLGSLQLHEQALEMWRKLLGNDHPDVAINLHNVAAVTFYSRDYALAKEKMQEVIRIFSANFPADHPYLGSAYFMMGRILNAQENYRSAAGYLEKALEIRLAKLPAGHPSIASGYYELGYSYFHDHRLQQSERMLLKAQQLFVDADDQENVARTRTLLEKL